MFIVALGLEALFREARLLSAAVKQWSERLHADLDMTQPMRGVLELLLVDGPTAVPSMARAHGVSRQHVQQQVDALLERGWVARRNNPAHRRSPLIELTDEGRALIQTVRAEERNALSRLQPGVSDQAVEDATQVLASWRATLRGG